MASASVGPAGAAVRPSSARGRVATPGWRSVGQSELGWRATGGLYAWRTATAPPSAVTVVQTDPALSQALTPLPYVRFAGTSVLPGVPVIHVNDAVVYQRFTGVGAAMTDSSAWLLYDQLPLATRQAVMEDLFGPAGIRLSFLRLPMGASDYTATARPYTYDDLPPSRSDPTLADFSISHDAANILPALRDAFALNPRLFIEALPWSPPAWMKSNQSLDNIDNTGTLLPSSYGPLAQYFVDFIEAYAAQGIPISAVAAANEPNVASAYPGLALSEQDEANFIANYLRPALTAAGLSTSIYGWDLSWGPLGAGDPLLDLSGGALSGLAWHCYLGSPDMMSGVHQAAPALTQIVDECTTGGGHIFPTSEALISSFRNWATAVSLWNLALDPSGGPVESAAGCGGCTGLVTVNEADGSASLGLDYYEAGQLSAFIQPGAVRVATENFVSYNLSLLYQTTITAGLDDVAFQNPDGSHVLVAYNNSTGPIPFAVEWRQRYLNYTIPGQATTTFTWGRGGAQPVQASVSSPGRSTLPRMRRLRPGFGAFARRG